MNKVTLKYLKKLLKHVEYYNNMAPFPPYDSSWVKDIRDRIKIMKETENNYDNEPVVACKYCKSLHIVDDEDSNAICFRCGSINELQEFKNIFDYETFVNKK